MFLLRDKSWKPECPGATYLMAKNAFHNAIFCELLNLIKHIKPYSLIVTYFNENIAVNSPEFSGSDPIYSAMTRRDIANQAGEEITRESKSSPVKSRI